MKCFSFFESRKQKEKDQLDLLWLNEKIELFNKFREFGEAIIKSHSLPIRNVPLTLKPGEIAVYYDYEDYITRKSNYQICITNQRICVLDRSIWDIILLKDVVSITTFTANYVRVGYTNNFQPIEIRVKNAFILAATIHLCCVEQDGSVQKLSSAKNTIDRQTQIALNHIKEIAERFRQDGRGMEKFKMWYNAQQNQESNVLVNVRRK